MNRLALAVALAACSTSHTPTQPRNLAGAPSEPVLGAAVSPGQVTDARSSFAGLASEPVLAAAMRYPHEAAARDEAPLSLTASDGTGLALVRLDARAVIDGPLAFTELHLRFRNPRDRVIEGRFAITLPPEATVSRLAMRLPTGWQEAEVVERQKARRAYEDFLHRRQDPALLEKEAGNEFRARIFPIPARGDKDIILSYSQPLAGAAYTLPLRGLPAIDELSVRALVARPGGAAPSYRAVTLAERGRAPGRDFEVAVPEGMAGIAHGELAIARIRPAVDSAPRPMDGVVILFDTSASRAPAFAHEVERLGQLIGELARVHGADTRLAVAAFDQSVMPVYEGTLGGFGRDQLDTVLARRPLGASNLRAALGWAGSRPGLRRVVLMTDSIATAGPTETRALRAAVEAMSGRVDRLDVILAGGIRDHELAARLARGALDRDGVVLDAKLPVAEQARRLGWTTVSGVKVAIPGAEWVWPRTLDGLQPGDEALVFASLGERSAPARLAVNLAGALTQTLEVDLVPVARPLIERAAARARIAQLMQARDELGGHGADPQADRRRALEREIVELSTRHRVLCDLTALLVLETEADYERYGIGRRGLADILTVGERGIAVMRRSQPVVLIARDAEDKKASKDEANKKRDKKTRPAKRKSAAPGRGDGDIDDGLDDGFVAAKPAQEPADGALAERDEAGAPEAELAAAPAAEPEPSVARSQAAPPPAMDAPAAVAEEKPAGPPPLDGELAKIMKLLERGRVEDAVVAALAWRNRDAGDVMALVALGEAVEARGNHALAARVYGSIIDLFPSRADMRRFAGERLERLGERGAALAADTYAKAVAQRPDHLTGHRLLGYALLRLGEHEAAFSAIAAGLARRYPAGRFAGGARILREDLGLIAAAWLAAAPEDRSAIEQRLADAGATLATEPSLRFVLYWETDANDVDFHIYDGHGGHAFYRQKELSSGGALYADVTTGYGPECFTIDGAPRAYPYTLQIHYYSRGPMGYGMGKLEIIEHDGAGGLRFDQRPFVVMNDGAYVDLGTVEPLAATATIAR